MYKKTIKEDGLTSWMKFYNLTNNKNTLDYADTVKAIVLINFTMEEFIIKREELEELVERGAVDRDVIDKSDSYIDKNIIYMPAGLNIHFHEKKGSEYNQYIFNVCYGIMMENINIYFNGIYDTLDKIKRENISKAKLLNSRYSDIIDRIMKILYLFNESDAENTGLNTIYRFISYSIKTEGIMLKSLIKEMLELLVEKSYIDVDYDGNYFIMSEERKDIRRKTVSAIKELDNSEVDKIIKELIKDEFSSMISEMGELAVNIEILGDKINRGLSNLSIKLDLYIGEGKDTKKGYYMLNTRQFDNVVYWYSNQDLTFYNKMKWLIAYSNAIDFYIGKWKHNKEKTRLLKHEHNNRVLIFKEMKSEILGGFENGFLIVSGENKKIDNLGNCKEILNLLINNLENKNRFKKILNLK